MIQQVKEKITKAFELFSKKDGLNMQEIRVKILVKDSNLNYVLLNKKDEIRKTSLNEMIGSMYALMAESRLEKAIKNVITENGVDVNIANVRLFLLPNNSPSAYLFEDGRAIKEIDIEKLIN